MPGAYCLIDYENVKDRFRRVQIDAAGVEEVIVGFFGRMIWRNQIVKKLR